MSNPICVPGVPVKRYNPCISPLQEVIPHIRKVFKIENGKIISSGYQPNDEDYPEYSYVIQMFIDTHMKDKYGHDIYRK